MTKLSKWWPLISVVFVLGQVFIALALKPGFVQTSCTVLFYFLLSGIATAAASRAASRSSGEGRIFWAFVACSYGLLWMVNWLWLWHVVVLRHDNPYGWLHEALFFVQTVPLMAAVTIYPHWKQSAQKLYQTTLNLLLILFFWVFLYSFFVFPYMSVDAAIYRVRYETMYFAENLALLIALTILILRTRPPWKPLYWHLFAASCLWTFGLQMENSALNFGGYHLGGLYDVPCIAACCWFVWVPLRGMQLAPQLSQPGQPDTRYRNFLSLSGMLVVVAIPLIGVWELFRDDASPQVHRIRLLAVLVSFVLMAVALFVKEYLANRELVDDISLNLRFSEERFYKAFNSSPEGITISTLKDGRYLEVNDAFLRMMECSRSELVGKTAIELEVWAQPEDRARLSSELLRTGRVRELQTNFRTRSGQIRQVEVSAEGIQLQSEPCLLAITRDVTMHRQLEQQLLQAQKMEAVGRLAGGVAHDFNNLLGVIMGYSELLAREIGANSLLSQRIDAIQTACQRAASLTGQLLAFSRRQVLLPKVLNLNSLVAETDAMLRRLIGEDVEAATVLDPGLGQVKADPGQIVQVIMNLAVNARDAMPNGGKLIIETANVTLPEGMVCHGVSVAPGSYVMLAVGDTGSGMNAETQGRIFEPFFTTKPVGEGTGLGLATVGGIVEQSGGHIFVDSQLTRGTTFKIYLPRVDAVAESAPPRTRSAQPQGSETILLVEDDSNLRDLVQESLQSMHYTVLVAASGQDALRLLERHPAPIDLLITDVIMPRMSGPELSQLVTTLRPGIKVLYMSGYTDDKLRDLPTTAPEIAWIQKPFQLHDLAQKLREVLNQAVDTSRPPQPTPEPAEPSYNTRRTGNS
jgi:two-component system, cell cycle sensor histidine kinase and response regulator CckA